MCARHSRLWHCFLRSVASEFFFLTTGAEIPIDGGACAGALPVNIPSTMAIRTMAGRWPGKCTYVTGHIGAVIVQAIGFIRFAPRGSARRRIDISLSFFFSPSRGQSHERRPRRRNRYCRSRAFTRSSPHRSSGCGALWIRSPSSKLGRQSMSEWMQCAGPAITQSILSCR